MFYGRQHVTNARDRATRMQSRNIRVESADRSAPVVIQVEQPQQASNNLVSNNHLWACGTVWKLDCVTRDYCPSTLSHVGTQYMFDARQETNVQQTCFVHVTGLIKILTHSQRQIVQLLLN